MPSVTFFHTRSLSLTLSLPFLSLLSSPQTPLSSICRLKLSHPVTSSPAPIVPIPVPVSLPLSPSVAFELGL